MKLMSIADLEIRERQREEDRKNISFLKESILSKGLMHAPVIATDPITEAPFLVAGWHRVEAMRALHEEERSFLYDNRPVPKDVIPYTNIADMTPSDIAEAELEENIIRAPLSWQDRSRALASIHEMRVLENPSHTYRDTARVLQKKGDIRSTDHVQTEVKKATLLSKNMNRPSVAKARNATEAYGILLKEEEARFEAELIARRKRLAKTDIPLIEVIHGDMLVELPTVLDGTFDLIVADPPYGISADIAGFRQRTVEHHNYADTPELAKELLQFIICEGFRITKNRANLFVFGDIDLFPFFKAQCSTMGWKPYRTPIIWQKSETEGLAPWGREGPRRTYELIFFATKGNKGLLQSPTDILTVKRVGRHQRRYGAEKPVELLEQLIECATMPGDYVLDPCCGAGSALAACRHLGRRALGIEIDSSAFDLATVFAERDLDEETSLEEELL